MDDDTIWNVIDTERAELAELLASVTPPEWEYPSLCAGWTVRDVAAHLTLAPTITLGGAVLALLRAGGGFNRMVRDTARRQARLPVEELVALLHAAVGTRRLAPGQRLTDALLDVLVHGQDIVLPLGRVHAMPAAAAVVAADHVWEMGFPFHARRRLRGLRLTATDVTWTVGDGNELTGPVDALLLLLAGRRADLSRLSGPGVPVLMSER